MVFYNLFLFLFYNKRKMKQRIEHEKDVMGVLRKNLQFCFRHNFIRKSQMSVITPTSHNTPMISGGYVQAFE